MRRVVASLPFVLAAGCWGSGDDPYELVRERAAQELRCPEDRLEVRYSGPAPRHGCPSDRQSCDEHGTASYYTAMGCGTVQLYRCVSRRSDYGGSTTCAPTSEALSM